MPLLIGDVFRSAALSTPKRTAVTLGNRSLSYGDLDQQANRCANALRGLGVRHGDRVVLWSDTSLEAVPLFAGLAKLGTTFAPANARLGPAEAAEMIALARPKLLVVDPGHAEAAEQVAKDVGVPLLRTGDESASALPGRPLADLTGSASADDVEAPNLVERDPHVIFFTSGSTGRSKGVVLSHRVNFLRTHPGALLEPRGTTVCMYPLFHMGAWTLALQAWQARSHVVLLEAATAEQVGGAVETHRAERLNCIPAVWQRILDEGSDRFDLSSLRVIDSGTSATPPELLAAITDRLPDAILRVFYGSTEAGSITLLEHDDVPRKPGSCGPPHSGVELRLSDAGEVCARSPVLFDGYFDNAEATAEALVDGWYHTGDLGVLDDEGFLSIVGRARDIIRTGGESVSPSEVEAALADHPALLDVAVVGVPDAKWGEMVCAIAVPRAGATVDLEALQKHCESRLARFKVPRRLEILSEIPRTAATNQVQRRLIIERLATRTRQR